MFGTSIAIVNLLQYLGAVIVSKFFKKWGLSNASLVACLSTTMMSITSYADVTGNVSVVSDYYARGIDQTSGASVQGVLHYQHRSGFYLSNFASNIKWYDKNEDGTLDSDVEWDFYAGYTNKLSHNFGYDVGLSYITFVNESKFNFLEAYAGINYQLNSPLTTTLSAKIFFSNDRNGYLPDPKRQDESAWYITSQADIQLKPSVILTPQVGYAFGDVFDQQRIGGMDEFFTYSLSLSKSFNDGFSAKFSYVGIDLDGQDNKVIIALNKSFAF